MEEKYCGYCKTMHPVSEFYKRKDTKDGLTYNCKKSFNRKDVIMTRSINQVAKKYGNYNHFTL